MVSELLQHGAANAITGKELARILNCDIRTITECIEAERRNGQPICANMRGENAGYFLAENEEELQEYCDRLHHRAGELYKTRGALIKILEQYKNTISEEA